MAFLKKKKKDKLEIVGDLEGGSFDASVPCIQICLKMLQMRFSERKQDTGMFYFVIFK